MSTLFSKVKVSTVTITETLCALPTATNGVLIGCWAAVWSCHKFYPCVGSLGSLLPPTLTDWVPWFWDRDLHPGALLGRPRRLHSCVREGEGSQQSESKTGTQPQPKPQSTLRGVLKVQQTLQSCPKLERGGWVTTESRRRQVALFSWGHLQRRG